MATQAPVQNFNRDDRGGCQAEQDCEQERSSRVFDSDVVHIFLFILGVGRRKQNRQDDESRAGGFHRLNQLQKHLASFNFGVGMA